MPPGNGPVQVKATLSADAAVADRSVPVRVSLWRGSEKLSERSMTVKTLPFLRPRIRGASAIRLVQGGTTTVLAQVQGNGNTDPWALDVEDLPPGIHQGPARGPVPAGSVGLELTADSDAVPVVGKTVRLVLRAGGIEADQTIVPLSLRASQRDPVVELTCPSRIEVRAGDRATVSVSLRRRNHDGPVRLVVSRLPREATVEPVTVPAGQGDADLVFQAPRLLWDTGRFTSNRVATVTIQAFVGFRLVGSRDATLVVQPPPAAPAPFGAGPLDGTWSVVSVDFGSRKSRTTLTGRKVQIADGKWSFLSSTGGATTSYQMTIDPKQNPPHIDLKRTTSTLAMTGIYELQGDTLRVLFASRRSKSKTTASRPTSFVDRPTVSILYTLRREK